MATSADSPLAELEGKAPLVANGVGDVGSPDSSTANSAPYASTSHAIEKEVSRQSSPYATSNDPLHPVSIADGRKRSRGSGSKAPHKSGSNLGGGARSGTGSASSNSPRSYKYPAEGVQEAMDATEDKPYLCFKTTCGKRYKNRNGLKYHYENNVDHGAQGLQLLASGGHPAPLYGTMLPSAKRKPSTSAAAGSQLGVPPSSPSYPITPLGGPQLEVVYEGKAMILVYVPPKTPREKDWYLTYAPADSETARQYRYNPWQNYYSYVPPPAGHDGRYPHPHPPAHLHPGAGPPYGGACGQQHEQEPGHYGRQPRYHQSGHEHGDDEDDRDDGGGEHEHGQTSYHQYSHPRSPHSHPRSRSHHHYATNGHDRGHPSQEGAGMNPERPPELEHRVNAESPAQSPQPTTQPTNVKQQDNGFAVPAVPSKAKKEQPPEVEEDEMEEDEMEDDDEQMEVETPAQRPTADLQRLASGSSAGSPVTVKSRSGNGAGPKKKPPSKQIPDPGFGIGPDGKWIWGEDEEGPLPPKTGRNQGREYSGDPAVAWKCYHSQCQRMYTAQSSLRTHYKQSGLHGEVGLEKLKNRTHAKPPKPVDPARPMPAPQQMHHHPQMYLQQAQYAQYAQQYPHHHYGYPGVPRPPYSAADPAPGYFRPNVGSEDESSEESELSEDEDNVHTKVQEIESVLDVLWGEEGGSPEELNQVMSEIKGVITQIMTPPPQVARHRQVASSGQNKRRKTEKPLLPPAPSAPPQGYSGFPPYHVPHANRPAPAPVMAPAGTVPGYRHPWAGSEDAAVYRARYTTASTPDVPDTPPAALSSRNTAAHGSAPGYMTARPLASPYTASVPSPLRRATSPTSSREETTTVIAIPNSRPPMAVSALVPTSPPPLDSASSRSPVPTPLGSMAASQESAAVRSPRQDHPLSKPKGHAPVQETRSRSSSGTTAAKVPEGCDGVPASPQTPRAVPRAGPPVGWFGSRSSSGGRIGNSPPLSPRTGIASVPSPSAVPPLLPAHTNSPTSPDSARSPPASIAAPLHMQDKRQQNWEPVASPPTAHRPAIPPDPHPRSPPSTTSPRPYPMASPSPRLVHVRHRSWDADAGEAPPVIRRLGSAPTSKAPVFATPPPPLGATSEISRFGPPPARSSGFMASPSTYRSEHDGSGHPSISRCESINKSPPFAVSQAQERSGTSTPGGEASTFSGLKRPRSDKWERGGVQEKMGVDMSLADQPEGVSMEVEE